MAITLRPVEEGDNAFLYQLYVSTRADEIAAWGWTAQQSEAFLQLQFRAQQQHYRAQTPQTDYQIICYDNQPIGQFILATTTAEIHLADIALLPEYRNRGFGSALIRNLLTTAAQTGRVVRLHVEVNNPALHLYERLGFRILDLDGIHYLMEASPESGT